MRINVMTSIAVLALAARAMADEGGNGGGGESVVTPVPVATAILTDETKVEAIGKVLRSRQTFTDRPESTVDGVVTPAASALELAIAKLEAGAKDTDSFYGLPIAIKGQDAESGEIDTALYDGAIVVLSTVGARIDGGKGKKISGLKGIVIYPLPTVEAFLADDAGMAWIAKLVEKEADLVSKRSYREFDSLAQFINGVAKAPGSVSEYVAESKRSGSALDTETFDALWTGLRAGLKEEQPAFAKLLPSKAEMLKALRSKSYAESQDNIAPLEARGYIVKLGRVLIDAAAGNQNKDGTPNPLPTEALEDWLANRDTVEIKKIERADLDFSALDSLDF